MLFPPLSHGNKADLKKIFVIKCHDESDRLTGLLGLVLHFSVSWKCYCFRRKREFENPNPILHSLTPSGNVVLEPAVSMSGLVLNGSESCARTVVVKLFTLHTPKQKKKFFKVSRVPTI